MRSSPFSQLVLLAAAATAAAAGGPLAAIAQRNFVVARVEGVGTDFFDEGLRTLDCVVSPTNGSAVFHTACSREQARDLGGGEVFTLELGPTPLADQGMGAAATPGRLETLRRLATMAPRTHIIRATPTGERRRARRHVADGPRSILLILLNYSDMGVNYISESGVRRIMQNPDGNRDVDAVFQASSYGRISFPVEQTKVISVTSPLLGAGMEQCDGYAMYDHAMDVLPAQHPEINPSHYVHHGIYIPNQLGQDNRLCMWAGASTVDSCHPGSPHCKVFLRTPIGPVLAHELGHNLGLMHASDDKDDDGVQDSEYGDKGSMMSNHVGLTTINAPHRVDIGYLGDDLGVDTFDMVDCTADSPDQVMLTISRLDLAPGDNPNPNMVRIPRFPSAIENGSDGRLDRYYLLSFKAQADWDGPSASREYVDRLQIHTHSDNPSENTMLVEKLSEGQVFVGEANQNGSKVTFTIRVMDVGDDVITVAINRGCGRNQGAILCDQNVTGRIGEGPGILTGPYWEFALTQLSDGRIVTQRTTVTFNGCAASNSTVIRVFKGLQPQGGPFLEGQNDAGCTLTLTLPGGLYSVTMDNGGGLNQGHNLSMTMSCEYPSFQGEITCGEVTSGDTEVPGRRPGPRSDVIGVAQGGTNGNDHFWDFTVPHRMTVVFNACELLRTDTHITILDRIEFADNGTALSTRANIIASDDNGCGAYGGPSYLSHILPAGNYSVVMEGYNYPWTGGVYEMTMECSSAAPTPVPTPAPTLIPTAAPTLLLTPRFELVGERYCPPGYGDYGLRYRWGLGRIVIVAEHQECADRCDAYSDVRYQGGCKQYMSGMYYGMLFCRSYGGLFFDLPCPYWARPSSSGINSGDLHSVDNHTNQENLGGNCCSRTLSLPPPTPTAAGGSMASRHRRHDLPSSRT